MAGTGGLSATDVSTILGNASGSKAYPCSDSPARRIARPNGHRRGRPDGTIIGLRQASTVFSIDVAATKARNMVYFNSSARLASDLNQVPMGSAVTNRTISFGAMPLFPPGIDGSSDGPFFNLYTMDIANPCTQGFQSGPANSNKSGIVFFPGSAGLFRNGVWSAVSASAARR